MSTKGEFVEILCFRYFARYMSFSRTGKMGKKKQIMNGIEVSVVLDGNKNNPRKICEEQVLNMVGTNDKIYSADN